MLFSKNRKLQRDRNAGLVFRWRGGYKANRGGFTVAFLLTALFFGAGFIMINVYAKQNTVPSRYRASMVQLGEVDDDLKWWIERNSPLLPSWGGDGDLQSSLRVGGLLFGEISERHKEKHRIEDVEMEEISIAGERVYLSNDGVMPRIGRHKVLLSEEEVSDDDVVVEWGVNVEAGENLRLRLPKSLVYDKWIPESWHGREVRFIVAVDDMGRVIKVSPSEWVEVGEYRGLEDWIQTIRFKPERGAVGKSRVGILDVSVMPVGAVVMKGGGL